MPSRLAAAMLSYGLFAVMAAFTLDGKIRIFTLIFLAGLALKTYLGLKTRP
jgi:hypothetical protein